MRTLFHGAVLLAISMLLFGCGHAEDKTVVNYCRSIEAGKYDEAASYLSGDARKMLETVGGKSRLADVSAQFKQHKGIKSIDISKRVSKGDNAQVEFVYSFNDGSKYADFFPLVKEGGNWKISR